MKHLNAKEIAELLGQSKRTVSIRAKKEKWDFVLLKGRGGQIPHFFIDHLPEDIKQAIHGSGKNTDPELKVKKLSDFETCLGESNALISRQVKQNALKSFAALHGKSKERAEAALFLLNMANQFAAEKDCKTTGWNTFIHAYNAAELDVPAHYFSVKKKISYSTLARWERQYQKGGIAALVPQYGKNKGNSVINRTSGMRDYCIALIHQYPHIKGARLAELISMEFGEEYELPSKSTCRRWLQVWKDENRTTFMSLVDPSGWQNKHMAAFGNRSAGVERINQLWEFDSTPADVMLQDGRYSIVGVIDVFTRRVKVVLKPTSNSEAIALLMRNALIDWGVPEIARVDNGADYQSAHIQSVWDALDIVSETTNPYSGWEKPFIERFFRTFSHGIAELLAGYIGHNVSEREKISSRLTFAQRLIEKREKGADRVALDVSLNAEQFETFINNWIENHYHHTRHEKLKCSPFEKYNAHKQTIRRIEDERMLDVLLAPVPSQNGFRTVGKEGISIEGMIYIHAELGAWVGDRVFCRYNPDDVGRVYVFHALHNIFICEAVNPEIAGNDITMAHAQEAKRVQRARLREQRDSVKRASKKYDVSNAAQKFLAYRGTQTGALTDFPKASEHVSTPAIDTAQQAKKASETEGYSDEQKSEFERRRKELEAVESLRSSSAEPIYQNDHHKARHYTQLNIEGRLSPTEKAWLHQYRRDNRKAAAMLDKLFVQSSKGN